MRQTPTPPNADPNTEDDVLVIANPVMPRADQALTTAGYTVIAVTTRHTIYSHQTTTPDLLSPTEDPSSMRKAALTVAETAHLLGISTSHTYELIQTDVIPAIRLGRRIVIPSHAIQQILQTPHAAH